jgi:hypothetical protein
MSSNIFSFEFFIPHSAESMSEKKEKITGKTIAGKLEVIREVEKNERNTGEIAQM